MIEPYHKLADYYYNEWGNFSLQYLQLIDYVASQYGFSPDSILDIACGTGNLISELHSMGKSVAGCDISPQMLKIAKEHNPYVEFHIVAMTEINLNRRFDLAVCAFDSVNYLLSTDDVSRLFAIVHAHLCEGGFFLFDVITLHKSREYHKTIVNREISGVHIKDTMTYDEQNNLAYHVLDFGTGQVERHVQKPYDDETITGLLKQNSFEILDTFANIEFDAPASDAKRLIYVVRKQ
ncbi:class I SAM-dependent DNA methyltransferase [Chloroflexota bacterium]